MGNAIKVLLIWKTKFYYNFYLIIILLVMQVCILLNILFILNTIKNYLYILLQPIVEWKSFILICISFN